MRSRPTIHSPFSQPDGQYPNVEFTETELQQLHHLKPHLSPLDQHETTVPYISRTLLTSAVNWFAQELISIIQQHGHQNILITYNLDGADWFWRKLRAALIHQAYPPDILNSRPIRVSTCTGLASFKPEVNKQKLSWLPAKELKKKIVISLDDIGDSGYTQAAIAEMAKKDGAKEVITVNLLEKLLPKSKKKLHSPDFALLISKYAFLIGGGLDSGTTIVERERRFRDLNLIAVLEQLSHPSGEKSLESAPLFQVATA